MTSDTNIFAGNTAHTVFSPYSGEPVGQVFLSGAADVDNAVKSAVKAFHSPALSLTPYDRSVILSSVGKALIARKEHIAKTITDESGKVIREARIEVDRAAATMVFAAEEAKRVSGRVLPCDITAGRTNKNAYVHRTPVGVIAAITPFNFPLNTVVHKIAPAIAAGNTVVLKPSLKTPLTSILLLELFCEAGCPPGLLSLVFGDIETGEALVQHPDVRMVNFTGSVMAGRRISQIAGMKKILLELGGNDPLIVFSDADLETAVKTAVEQGLGTCGQRCTAVKRVFIEKSVHQKFISLLEDAVSRLKIGDPYDADTDLGPMISPAAAEQIENVVDEAVNAGAGVVCRGGRNAAVLDPIVLDHVPLKCRLINEETFGPVLPVMEFDSVDEVIQLVNMTRYGLQAGVFTNRMDVVKKLFHQLEVGALVVNGGPGFRVESIPFGGVKDSGLGREGIISAVEEMTELKTLIW